MYSTDQYRLACTPEDYKYCHDFLRGLEDDRPLHFPTIAAIRDGKIIGVIGGADLKRTKRVAVNTLRVSPEIKNSSFIFIRLTEAYENILRSAGTNWYWIAAYKANGSLCSALRRVIGLPQEEDKDHYWFRKELA